MYTLSTNSAPPTVPTRWFLLCSLHALLACGEEPLPPNCNTYLGRQCDKTLLSCVMANSTDHTDKQCQCYETYVDCLRGIDPQECMRGAHCKLYDNACKAFYCKPQPLRCPVCYAESEIDMPHAETSLFFGMVSSPPGILMSVLIVLFLGYQCGSFANQVVYHGASCRMKTCPFYKHWKKFNNKKKIRKGCKKLRKKLKKYVVNVQRKYHHVGREMNSDNEQGTGDNSGSEEDQEEEEEPLAGLEMHEGSEQKRGSAKQAGKSKRKKKKKKKKKKEGHKQPELV